MNGENPITLLLKNGQSREIVLAQVLRIVLTQFHSETGTIHRLDAESNCFISSRKSACRRKCWKSSKPFPSAKALPEKPPPKIGR